MRWSESSDFSAKKGGIFKSETRRDRGLQSFFFNWMDNFEAVIFVFIPTANNATKYFMLWLWARASKALVLTTQVQWVVAIFMNSRHGYGCLLSYALAPLFSSADPNTETCKLFLVSFNCTVARGMYDNGTVILPNKAEIQNSWFWIFLFYF